MADEITLQEVEDARDAVSQEPEKFTRDAEAKLVEAITSTVAAVGKAVLITE